MNQEYFSLCAHNEYSDFVIHFLGDDVVIERKDIWQGADSTPFVYYAHQAWQRAFNGLPVPSVDDLTLEQQPDAPICNPALATLIFQAQRELETD